MRKRLCQEGNNFFATGETVEPGCLQFDPQSKYPLVAHNHMDYGWDMILIGYITDVRREEDGWITGEVVMRNNEELPEDSRLSGYIKILASEGKKVTSAALRGASLVPVIRVSK